MGVAIPTDTFIFLQQMSMDDASRVGNDKQPALPQEAFNATSEEGGAVVRWPAAAATFKKRWPCC